jgi:hypothetical protein
MGKRQHVAGECIVHEIAKDFNTRKRCCPLIPLADPVAQTLDELSAAMYSFIQNYSETLL